MDDEVNDIEQTNRNYILATCAALGGFEEKLNTSSGKLEKVYMLGDEALGKPLFFILFCILKHAVLFFYLNSI